MNILRNYQLQSSYLGLIRAELAVGFPKDCPAIDSFGEYELKYDLQANLVDITKLNL